MTVLVAQTAVNIAEAYYVGFLGTDALAGAALVFPIFMLMTMMSNGGFGSGVASSVARAVGAGRRDDADAALFHAIVLAIIVGAVVHAWRRPPADPCCIARSAAASGALDCRTRLFELSVRRRDPGLDRQPAAGRAARVR